MAPPTTTYGCEAPKVTEHRDWRLRKLGNRILVGEPSDFSNDGQECERLWKDYGDASLQRVRAYGNLALANLRSDSETMEMLAEATALANQKLEEVKRKIQEHEATGHAFQKPAYPTS